MKYFLVKDSNDEIISSNLESVCEECFNKCNTIGKVVELCKIDKNSKRRYGKISNTKGTVFLCCDKTKTTKLFKEKLEALSYASYDLKIPKKELTSSIKSEEQKRVNRLVHNLTSINAHNIQELYDFVPQAILTVNINDQLEKIQEEILSDTKNAAMMFLRIAKHNIHMKSEFSIYRKLDRSTPTLDKRKHSIHKVLMNVLHTFFVDFSDKNVFVNVGECREFVLCDYEVIQVAFYHIIENSSKYVKHNSQVDISFAVNGDFIELKFSMFSLHIEEVERDKIFTEGYSGKEARKIKKNGEGIGLWRVKQMLELNDSTITIIPGNEIELVRGFRFSKNEIIIGLKKY